MRINLVHSGLPASPVARRTDVTRAILVLLLSAACVLALAQIAAKEPSASHVPPQRHAAPATLGDPAILHHHGLNTADSPGHDNARAAERFHHR